MSRVRALPRSHYNTHSILAQAHLIHLHKWWLSSRPRPRPSSSHIISRPTRHLVLCNPNSLLSPTGPVATDSAAGVLTTRDESVLHCERAVSAHVVSSTPGVNSINNAVTYSFYRITIPATDAEPVPAAAFISTRIPGTVSTTTPAIRECTAQWWCCCNGHRKPFHQLVDATTE